MRRGILISEIFYFIWQTDWQTNSTKNKQISKLLLSSKIKLDCFSHVLQHLSLFSPVLFNLWQTNESKFSIFLKSMILSIYLQSKKQAIRTGEIAQLYQTIAQIKKLWTSPCGKHWYQQVLFKRRKRKLFVVKCSRNFLNIYA